MDDIKTTSDKPIIIEANTSNSVQFMSTLYVIVEKMLMDKGKSEDGAELQSKYSTKP